MNHLSKEQKHKVCLFVVTLGCVANAALSVWAPNYTLHIAALSLSTNLIWIWS